MNEITIPQNELDIHFDDFLKEQIAVRGPRKATLEGYIAAFRLFRKLVPEVDLKTIQDRSAWINFFTELQTRERIVGTSEKRTGVKNSTLLTYRSKLSVFMRWLKDTGLIKENPLPKIPKPHATYTDRRYLSGSEIQKLIQVCEYGYKWQNLFLRSRNLTIVKVLLHTGVRRGELLGLRLEDVDFVKRKLTVRAESSKSKMRREIPLSPELQADLRQYVKMRQDHPISYTTHALFVSATRDNALTQHGLKHLVELLSEKSGVHFHLHRGRHTFAANLTAQHVPTQHLQELMGHLDPRMTLKYGRNVGLETLRASVEKMGTDGYID